MKDRASPTVQVGQVWIDNDKRHPNRAVRVDRLEGDYAYATCGYLQDRVFVAFNRTTRIALSRFRPISTGYRLHTVPVEP